MGCQPGPRRRWVIAKGCHLQGHEPVMLVGADPVDLNSTSRVEHAQPGPGPARRQQAHAALDKQRFADRQGDLERAPQAPWHAPGCIPGAERLQIDLLVGDVGVVPLRRPDARGHGPCPPDGTRPAAIGLAQPSLRLPGVGMGGAHQFSKAVPRRISGHPAGSRPKQLVARSAFDHHADVRSSHRGSERMRAGSHGRRAVCLGIVRWPLGGRAAVMSNAGGRLHHYPDASCRGHRGHGAIAKLAVLDLLQELAPQPSWPPYSVAARNWRRCNATTGWRSLNMPRGCLGTHVVGPCQGVKASARWPAWVGCCGVI